jgi:hypothetical protein
MEKAAGRPVVGQCRELHAGLASIREFHRCRLPPMSVFTQPGWAELTLIPVPFSSWARWTVKAFSAVFDAS